MNISYLDLFMPGRDPVRDRQLGHQWERAFCLLAAHYHKSFTPHQIGRPDSAQWYTVTAGGIHPLLLPDVTVWTSPGEHHEIKHKNPTDSGCYGLEKYRLDALVAFRRETNQPVLYTVHDWERAGARTSREPMANRIEDWLTVDVDVLAKYVTQHHLESPPFPTWVNGSCQLRPGYFWPVDLWTPLEDWWDEIPF